MSTHFGQKVGKRSKKNAGYETAMGMHTRRLKKFRPEMWQAEIEENKAELRLLGDTVRLVEAVGTVVDNTLQKSGESVMQWLEEKRSKKEAKRYNKKLDCLLEKWGK